MTTPEAVQLDIPPEYKDIKPGTYTALRLQHASVEHLNLTTRRCFVGPIPEGWLNSHRKSWYSQGFGLSSYSSKAATFSASPGVSHQRQITGLDGPSVSATFASSFPQPEDAGDDDDDHESDGGGEDDEVGSQDNENFDKPGNGVKIIKEEAPTKAGSQATERSDQKRRQNDHLKPPEQRRQTSATNASFVTASERPPEPPPDKSASKSVSRGSAGKSLSGESFVTAREIPASRPKNGQETILEDDESQIPKTDSHPPSERSPRRNSFASQNRLSNGRLDGEDTQGSKTQLLGPEDTAKSDSSAKAKAADEESTEANAKQGVTKPKGTGLVKFNLAEDIEDGERRMLDRTASKIGHARRQRIWKRMRRGTAHPGEIVKMEKMLVRVDTTMNELPPDFDENDSLEIESRTVEKWREFIVVCRESTTDDCQFFIQLYKTRVIPAKDQSHVEKRSTREIPLSHKNTHVNLYSSLDKTLVLWLPWKKQSTMMYIMRPHSSASAVEWYTFIRNSLGWKRPSTLFVHVPHLSVTLQLKNPFSELEESMNAIQEAQLDETSVAKTMDAEKAVSHTIIQRSLAMLENNPEWSSVLSAWLAQERIGLAWKRYDRLEWVHGANEQRMYGTMAMQRTHELELRPKEHYPTEARTKNETMTEPAPVEGFLVRLTSRKGTVQKLGKMYYKRLYFTTHNQYLCYTRPAKALPPPPPDRSMKDVNTIPSTQEIVDHTPLIFAVNPYPDDNQDGEVDWLQYGTAAVKERRDMEAYKESERQINTMLRAEGYINLSHVVHVRGFTHGSSQADENIDHQGSDVDFHEEVADTTENDGKTQSVDEARTFELAMENKLVVRLQAFNEATKREWIHRLRNLVRYWKFRIADDMGLLKSVRKLNLEKHEIDEEQEAYLGQFGEKWEVTKSAASPRIFHMCGISCCRAITTSGTVYYKPRRHTTFLRCGAILCHGRLLIFHDILRTHTGRPIPHIQHDRQTSIDLRKCYVYSGLITGDDLLNQSETFDSNHPGHHALPRVYLEDGWTSQDENTMTCFVIWQPRTQSWFKASEEEESTGKTRQKLRHVSRLGVTGRSIVFRTRSRAERDHWVMNISMEIERLRDREDIRVVDED